MPYSTSGLNDMVTGVGSTVTHVGLYTDLGVEASGGSPAYARRPVTWAATSGAQRLSSVDITPFDIPAGTYASLSYHTAITAGTLKGTFALGGFEIEAASVASATDLLTDFAHGIVNGNRVFVYGVHTNAVPTGLALATLYYVVGATTDTFSLSTTSGGSPVNIVANGKVFYQKCAPVVAGGQSTVPFTAGNIAIDLRLLT